MGGDDGRTAVERVFWVVVDVCYVCGDNEVRVLVRRKMVEGYHKNPTFIKRFSLF